MAGWVALGAFLIPLPLSFGPLENSTVALPVRFERSYRADSRCHLTITNVSGEIRLGVWDRNEVLARGKAGRGSEIEERIAGDSIEIWVKPNGRMEPVDFNLTVPAKASVSLKNKVGEISVTALAGHLKVDSVDGNVHLIDMRSPSIDVKVIDGDILFEGDFAGSGPYTFQSIRGDIDLTLPSTTSFNFAARALKRESINLGQFQCNQCSQQPKFIAGSHLKGGPRVVITAYDGRILLHQR